MADSDVLEIPGHPGDYAIRIAIEMWIKAGSPEYNSAGRLYGEQKYLYDNWVAGTPGFYPADNPDAEWQPLAHVRFGAFDFRHQADIARAKAAGFIFPYPYEWWHGEVPNVRQYPLVRSLPAPAVESSKPITPSTTTDPEGEDMRYMAVVSTKGPLFYVYGIDDAEQISQEEASALKKAAGGADDTFQRVNAIQGRTIINGIKRRRQRKYAAQAGATSDVLEPRFDEMLAELDAIPADVVDEVIGRLTEA